MGLFGGSKHKKPVVETTFDNLQKGDKFWRLFILYGTLYVNESVCISVKKEKKCILAEYDSGPSYPKRGSATSAISYNNDEAVFITEKEIQYYLEKGDYVWVSDENVLNDYIKLNDMTVKFGKG